MSEDEFHRCRFSILVLSVKMTICIVIRLYDIEIINTWLLIKVTYIKLVIKVSNFVKTKIGSTW